jgi:hypothetical protein
MFATSKVGALEFLNDAWLYSDLISSFSNWSSVTKKSGKKSRKKKNRQIERKPCHTSRIRFVKPRSASISHQIYISSYSGSYPGLPASVLCTYFFFTSRASHKATSQETKKSGKKSRKKKNRQIERKPCHTSRKVRLVHWSF